MRLDRCGLAADLSIPQAALRSVFILTGIAGALVHAGLNWGESAILDGASGAVFGLLGAGAFV